MTLAEGYKDTELGPIPQDWDVATVAEVVQITTGSRNTQDKVEDGQFPFFVRSQTVERINSFSYDGEAVLTAGDGVGTGKIFHYINGPFDCHQRVYRMSGFGDRMDGFFFYKCFSASFYERIMSMTAKSSVDSVRREMIADMAVPVPPIGEQKLIAQALRDIDGLIASLDALIAKKRDIKQAAMQQLLTGKTRLKGFDGPWVTQRLGELSKIKTGSRNNQDKSDSGEYPFFVRSATVERISTFSYDCEAILVPGEGGIGSIFHYVLGKFDAHQRVYVINDFRGIVGRFLYHQMVMSFGPYAMQNSVKATVDSLRLPTFQTFEVHLPSSMEEQIAIAEAIDAFVNEITILEARMEKFTALKEGMMQQLLTGRIRLV